MSKIVIFGLGDIAQLAHFYFMHDSNHEVVAFTVDKAYMEKEEFEGLPVVAFEDVVAKYPPVEYKMFIALSYANMNHLRCEKYFRAKEMGYTLESYISSKCSYLSHFPPGDNAFILEDNTIQPFVHIGNNVTLWSGNHIGHHSTIEDHNFISSHVVVSGHCTIRSFCFVGVNSTLAHKVILEKGTLVGAGAVIAKSTEEEAIYVPAKGTKLDKKSSEIKL